MIRGWKLFRVRRDGTLGSLFIARRDVIPGNRWLRAKCHATRGFKVRPGWHACAHPAAPHLSTKGRMWLPVALKGVEEHRRPKEQGGLWYVAKHMKVLV